MLNLLEGSDTRIDLGIGFLGRNGEGAPPIDSSFLWEFRPCHASWRVFVLVLLSRSFARLICISGGQTLDGKGIIRILASTNQCHRAILGLSPFCRSSRGNETPAPASIFAPGHGARAPGAARSRAGDAQQGPAELLLEGGIPTS